MYSKSNNTQDNERMTIQKRHDLLGCNAYCRGDMHAIVAYQQAMSSGDTSFFGLALLFARHGLNILSVEPAHEAPVPPEGYDMALQRRVRLDSDAKPYLVLYTETDAADA